MNLKYILDNLTSNLIVLISYLIVLLIWNLNYNNGNLYNYIYFPFGIMVLGFLFFGNKVIIAYITGNVIYFYVCQKYNLNLLFSNYFISSIAYILSIPLTLFVMNGLNIKVGVGKEYRFDKTNIYHVFIITFLSSITFLIITFCFSLILEYDFKENYYSISNLIGGITLITILKIIVSISYFFKKKI